MRRLLGWLGTWSVLATLAMGCENGQPQGDEFRGEDDLEEPVGRSGEEDVAPDGRPGIDQSAGD